MDGQIWIYRRTEEILVALASITTLNILLLFLCTVSSWDLSRLSPRAILLFLEFCGSKVDNGSLDIFLLYVWPTLVFLHIVQIGAFHFLVEIYGWPLPLVITLDEASHSPTVDLMFFVSLLLRFPTCLVDFFRICRAIGPNNYSEINTTWYWFLVSKPS